MTKSGKLKLLLLILVAITISGLYLLFRTSPSATEEGPAQTSPFPSASDTVIPVATTSRSTTTAKTGLLDSISNLLGLGGTATDRAGQKIGKILPVSISGYKLADNGNSIIFMEKATGHIARLDPKSGTTTIISNTTMPGVEEVYFGTTGTDLLMIARYLKDEWSIESLSGSIPLKPAATASSSSSLSLKSAVLDSRSYAFAVSPDGKRLFSLNLTPADEAIGLVSDFSFKKPLEVFRSPLTEWLPTWVSAGTVTLQTKSSGSAQGFLFSLDLNTSSFTKILGGVDGLTTLPSAGAAKIAYSGSADGFKLKVFVPSTKDTLSYSLRTLPEKCAWASDGLRLFCAVPQTWPAGSLLPDEWYSDEVSFSDDIWLINTKTGETTEIYKRGDVGGVGSFDAINLTVSPRGDSLYFQNKDDGTLWVLDLQDNSFIPAATPNNKR